MEAELMQKTEALAAEIAMQATTIEELNGVMRSLMKSALERMLNTEIDVHLGRRTLSVLSDFRAASPAPAALRPAPARIAAMGIVRKRFKATSASCRWRSRAIATGRSSRSSLPSISGDCRGSTRRFSRCMPRA